MVNERTLRSFVSRDTDPIAHRGKIRGAARLVAEAAADFRPTLEASRSAVQTALLFEHWCDPERCEP